jgi:FixJ family two-component response regulator
VAALTRDRAPTLQTRTDFSPSSGAMRILHIEDNSSDALLAQSYLRGVIPDVEFDSAERICEVTPQIVAAASCAILDLSLPDASGLEALQVLRAMSVDLPIIVLTGFDDLELGLSAIRNGAEDYLVKNYVDGDSLQRAIRYAMERRRLGGELARELSRANPQRTAPDSDTHQVLIEINADTSVFSLHCQTCSWGVTSDSAAMASWGALERTLLPHVAFGGHPRPSPMSDAIGAADELILDDGSGAEALDVGPTATASASDPESGDVHTPRASRRSPARRDFLAPGVWLG